MQRAGVGRRLPAVILDVIFAFLFSLIAVVLYAAVGGAQLGLQVQRAIGVEVGWISAFNEDVYEQYEARAEQMAVEMEQLFRASFTDEQAAFIGDQMEEALGDYFIPDEFSLRYFMQIDEQEIYRVIDAGFDRVIAAEREDIDPAVVNELRRQVKAMVDQFAIGTILPAVVDFALWLALIPGIVFLVYWLTEAFFGRTLGKLILGVRVMNADGERAVVATYFLRYFIKNLPWMLILIGILARVPALFPAAGVGAMVILVGSFAMIGREKRALHDFASNTAVYLVNGPANWS